MKLVAFNKHEDGYAAVWKGKTEKAPAAAVGEECPICCLSLLFGFKGEVRVQKDFNRHSAKTGKVPR